MSFSLRAGEVVGLAGLVGAGRSDVAARIFGVQPATSGRIFVRGREVRINGPRDAIRLEIGLVPEDRKRQGLVHRRAGGGTRRCPCSSALSTLKWVRRGRSASWCAAFHMLRVRTPSIDTPVAGLSGGNQQKVVLARWLAARAKILILDEPTRGVDVGAKAEIHALIGDLAARGARCC